VAVIKSSSSRAGERWWWWCLSTHARSRFIVGVLCLGVVCTQGKFEVVYKDDTTGEEPAARMIDEKCRRDYKRARLTVSTTRCSPSATDPNGQAIGGARSGGE
jgi:hypothetical protein